VPPDRSARHGAFTLIELLVVVAIVAVLAAILFPVFAQARAQGKRAACLTQIRQLTLGNLMYASENEGSFVPAAQDHFEFDRRRWFGIRSATGRFDQQNGPLTPYLKDGGLLRRCPEFQTRIGFDLGTGGYVYNPLGVGSLVWSLGYVAEAFHGSGREVEISEPANLAMFADGALDVGSGLAEYAFLIAPPAVLAELPVAPAWPLDPSVHFRHQGGAQVSFCDGHLRVLRRTLSVSTSGVYLGANPEMRQIGWFGPTEGKTLYAPPREP